MAQGPYRSYETQELIARRQAHRARQRRRRRLLGVACLVATFALAVVAGTWVAKALHGSSTTAKTHPPGASPAALTHSTSASPTPSWIASSAPASTTASPKAKPSATVAATGESPEPPIQADFIAFSDKRRQETMQYSLRHYGSAEWRLDPKVIVLHYTDGSTVQSAWNLFESNVPNVGELPGTVSHFLIDKDGTIYQLLPLDVRGRHTIGLNDVAIGIEFVQEGGSGTAWATGQIFNRPAQIDAGLRLVRWLQWRYHISSGDVIGHGIANQSPFFHDLEGWTNNHTDWNLAEIDHFRSLLATSP